MRPCLSIRLVQLCRCACSVQQCDWRQGPGVCETTLCTELLWHCTAW